MLRVLIVLFWLSLIVGTLVAHNVVANWAVTLAALFFTRPLVGWSPPSCSDAGRGFTARWAAYFFVTTRNTDCDGNSGTYRYDSLALDGRSGSRG